MITLKRPMIIAATLAALSFVFGSAAPTAALAAATRIVDDNYPSFTACPGAAYASIQAAVNTFNPGESGSIKVCAGTYAENVSMTGLGNISIKGKPGATLIAPGPTPMITATNTTLLTMQGLILNGAGYSTGNGMITADESSLAVAKNFFQNCPNCNGIFAFVSSGARSLKVTRNDFSGIGGGVYARSTGGALSAMVTSNDFTINYSGVIVEAVGLASPTATVTGNRLKGPGIGIQVQGVNKAKVSGNKVDGFGIGISLLDSSLARVSKNKIRSSERGIYISAGSADASSNKVTGNSFEAAGPNFIGVNVIAYGGMAADFNQIKGNTITDPGSVYDATSGVYLITSGGTIDGTEIKGNKLVNIDTPYTPGGATNTVISGNTCTPAAPCIP